MPLPFIRGRFSNSLYNFHATRTLSATMNHTNTSLPTPPITHGGNIVAMAKQIGCTIAELTDMSSNLTPFGPAPELIAFLRENLSQIGFLPEPTSEHLVHQFAKAHGLADNQVLAGSGTTEFIFALPVASGCNRAIIVTPTYADYFTACAWAGLPVETLHLTQEEQFRFKPDRLADSLRGDELVFLCNPNNPTGVLTPSETLYHCIVRQPNTLFVVDESYLPFCTSQRSLVDFPARDNLLVLTSFSKIYGIAGLRLGFLSGSSSAIAHLTGHGRPWGVNRLAQLAGEFCLEHGAAIEHKVTDFMTRERPAFVTELAKLNGIEVVPGQANFILCRLTGTISVAELAEKMLLSRIMIRNCGNFRGLDDSYFRLCLKTSPENAACLNAMRGILGTR